MSNGFPLKRILKRNGSVVAYDRERITTAIFKAASVCGTPDRALAETMAAHVETALVHTYGSGAIPTVEDVQDVVEKVLMEQGRTKIARDYIIYRHERAMIRAARASAFEVTDNVPYKKIYEVLRWNVEHRCDSVGSLNALIASGQFPQLVRDTDRRYHEEIRLAAGLVLERIGKIRIVIVAGPSSSGKTTTMAKLSERLKVAGVGFRAINIDHYFFDLVKHPRDEFGDYDYETPDALDLPLINHHLADLLAGKTIKTPHYDFKSGKRTLDVHELALRKDEILLIDSLHGLYGPMTESVPAEAKFRFYIETLGQMRAADGGFMRWADNRLLRRMIRDRDQRNSQPIDTLTHWHYVRRSELKNIIPFIKTADFILNSALPYEIPILRHKLFRLISSATRRYKDDAKRLDAHIRANRVYDLLKPLKGVADDSCVPPDSLLREFIGGSSYDAH